MFKAFIIMASPIWGDVKIHRFFVKERSIAREKLKDLNLKENQFNEREERFREDLGELLKKYGIQSENGSPISFPSRYIVKERVDLGDTRICSTIIPELATYFTKYFLGGLIFYQLYSF